MNDEPDNRFFVICLECNRLAEHDAASDTWFCPGCTKQATAEEIVQNLPMAKDAD